MADPNGARIPRAVHHHAVDIDAVLRSAHVRTAGRIIRVDGAALTAQRHADAMGRGAPAVPPGKVRSNRG